MTRTTILFLAANPTATGLLALDREARSIRAELDRSGYGRSFAFETRCAAQPMDLLRELRQLRPTVVHFSGHGGYECSQPHGRPARRDVRPGRRTGAHEPHGLFFEAGDGSAKWVSTSALEEVFRAAGSSVKLIVLNACYSESQAKALATYVDCVVGVSGSIGDDAAKIFAVGFYGGLGERESVDAAHRQGRAAISLEGLRDTDRPQLIVREGVDARQLVLASERRNVADDEARDEDALAHTEPIILLDARDEDLEAPTAPTTCDESHYESIFVERSRHEDVGPIADPTLADGISCDETPTLAEQAAVDGRSDDDLCAHTDSMLVADLIDEEMYLHAESVHIAGRQHDVPDADSYGGPTSVEDDDYGRLLLVELAIVSDQVQWRDVDRREDDTAARSDLATAQDALIAAQGALLAHALAKLADVAARIAALPTDAVAIAELAAELANSNETIHADHDDVTADLRKVASRAR